MKSNALLISFFLTFFFCLPSYSQLLSRQALDTAIVYTSMEEALEHPDQVYRLELKRQKIKALPPEILKLKNLQSLNLRNNQLKEFPKELAQLEFLQELDLSKNKLDTLYAEIGALKNLTYLNLNNNELIVLPKEIGQLSKLEKLDLWSNYIEIFPEEMKHLKSLKELDVRVISMNDQEQQYLFNLLPNAKIHFSHSCNCN